MKSWTAAPEVDASRILLIDDNRNGLAARKVILQELGHTITTANSPEEGLEQFAKSQFDLVITDYKMPRMNGDAVIASMRKQRADIPIILLSGLVDCLGLTEQNTGADIVVAKTNNEVMHLTRAITRLLRRKPVKKPVKSQASTQRAKVKSV